MPIILNLYLNSSTNSIAILIATLFDAKINVSAVVCLLENQMVDVLLGNITTPVCDLQVHNQHQQTIPRQQGHIMLPEHLEAILLLLQN